MSSLSEMTYFQDVRGETKQENSIFVLQTRLRKVLIRSSPVVLCSLTTVVLPFPGRLRKGWIATWFSKNE